MIVTEQARESGDVQNPAYRLIRHKVSEDKAVNFSWSVIVARLWQIFVLKSRQFFCLGVFRSTFHKPSLA